jgi:hypothetical protein
MKNQKIRDPTKVKYDIFMECAKAEPIDFWKNVLESCAYGQFPKGMTYRDHILYYKVGKKKAPITRHISENVEEAKKSVIDFFKAEVGYISRDEVLRRKIQMHLKLEQSLRPHDTVWKDIRAPTTQKQIVINYALKQQETLGLSDDLTNQLIMVILIGLSLETIVSDDIEMDRGVILEIDNLERLENGYFTVRRKRTVRIPYAPKQEKQYSQKSFYDGWDKRMGAYTKAMSQN